MGEICNQTSIVVEVILADSPLRRFNLGSYNLFMLLCKSAQHRHVSEARQLVEVALRENDLPTGVLHADELVFCCRHAPMGARITIDTDDGPVTLQASLLCPIRPWKG